MLPPSTIDAHHHLWRYTPTEFGWIDDEMAILRRDFFAPEFDMEAAHLGVAQTVAVQARPTLAENDFLLSSAAGCSRIAGVVGWAPLREENLGAILKPYAANPLFVGVREMVQGEAAGYLDQPEFDRGMRELTELELSFDLLLRRDQLAEATRLVDRHPRQRFVLDHAAKPNVKARELAPWSADLRELARRDNVCCKLSGLITEADWKTWTPQNLLPYLDLCVDSFGPERLMAGSDWPVCLVASEPDRWWATLDEYFGSFTAEERDAIFFRTARDTYRLNRSTAS